MRTKIFYQIREYKTPSSYSTPMGMNLRPRHRAIKLITRLTIAGHRDVVMVPFKVNCKA